MVETVYFAEAMRVAQACFAMWHRDPAAPSFGCFDRQYWGWKKKDLADSALQASVALCIRFAEQRGQTGCLPDLLAGFVDYLGKLQHADGSFDQMYPFEKAPGVVHDILSALLLVWRGPYLSAARRDRVERIIRRGIAFALKADEKHGEIANHFAHYAFELIQAGRELDIAEAARRGEYYLERTLALLSPEGWFNEYDGADAGYQTRLLAYLTRIAALTGDGQLWHVSGKAARFVEAMLMPDNSFHPMLGVRSTALNYPSGFERLAAHDPDFGALADRAYASWEQGTGLLPSMIDLENGIRIADDAFDAAALRLGRGGGGKVSVAVKSSDFPDAGLYARATSDRVVYIGARLGGVVVSYARDDSGWRWDGEDAGYLLRSCDGAKRWVTRHAGGGRLVEAEEDRLVIETEFAASLHEDLSPLQLILLRVLNLTVLRSQIIGDVFRKLVVRRLISAHHTLPLLLRRIVTWDAARVTIEDRFVALSQCQIPRGVQLFRCRRVTGNHMASARYFALTELTGGAWTEEIDPSVLSGTTTVRRYLSR